MGITSSKAKAKRRPHPLHVPKGYYAYEHGLPPNYWPQPMPYYGFGQPGYLPNYGPPVPSTFMPQYAPQMPQPQPQPYWPPQPMQEAERSKKRRKTRRRTPTATLTFSTSRNGLTRPSAEPNEGPAQFGEVQPMQESPPATSSNTNPSTRPPSATPTPQPQTHSPPPPLPLDSGTGPNHEHATPSRLSHSRSASVQIQASPAPLQASSATPPAQTPSTDSRIRTPNPLPEPPRDIYASSPYKYLLAPKALPTLPTVAQTIIVKQESAKQPKKKGIFSKLRRKKSVPKETQEVRYVFVPQGPSPFNSQMPPPTTQVTPPANHVSPSTSHVSSSPSHVPPLTPAPQASPAPTPTPRLPSTSHSATPSPRESVLAYTAPEPEPEPAPIYFNQDTEYAPFLNHSLHTVAYERANYPTATHLLEAFKFMPLRPDIAETIRMCEDTADVYELSAENAAHQSPNYGPSYLDMMETVVYLKFNQHADLRHLLLGTESAPLIYDDPSDSYWGIGVGVNGTSGQNELGHVLERVRERLRQDRQR